jgi:SAM-dependent methyltransferase
MDSREVGKVWDVNAPAWIELSRAGYDVYRDLLNTPAFLAMLPDVAGRTGLDLGCGEGHNTRLLAQRGATMVGLDISAVMALAATDGDRSSPTITVVVADGLTLPFGDGSFDFVVAFMSLMDMPEPPRVLAEVARVLRPGGFVQLSVTHPFTNTPVRRWVHDESGQRVALATGGYFDEVPYTETWLFGAAPDAVRSRHQPFAVPRFPLTMAGWLNAIAVAGLVLEEAGEPCVSEATAAAHPEVADTRLAPCFLHLRARRPLPLLSAPAKSPAEAYPKH